MDYLDSTSARLNSRISSTSLAMTRATHRSPCHAASGPIVCYRIWDKSVIVRRSLASFIGQAYVAHECSAFLCIYFFLLCVVNSIVLLTNGISFAFQAVLLLIIGAWADYGTWRCAGLEPSRGAEWTPAVPKQAENLDCFYYSAGGRLVCMAWRSGPIAMASRRRVVYPWQ